MSSALGQRRPEFDELDISSTAFWAMPPRKRDERFAELRRDKPVSFHAPPEGGLIPPTEGFWAVVRHADVRHVSRNPELFCSGQGVSFEDVPIEVAEATGAFLPTDAPRHTRLRGLVSDAFTPRRVRLVAEQIEQHAADIVAEVLAAGECDLVSQVSMRLPLWTISEMIGVPEDQRAEMHDAANIIGGVADPEIVPEGDESFMVLLTGMSRLQTIAREMQSDRRSQPRDDLMTALVEAQVDGELLTADEICAFFVLLAFAGNDTTRNTISHSVLAFAENPEQWDLLRSDIDTHLPSAVEEMIRWASPVTQFRRTATRETQIAGQPIAQGDRVVIFYSSANRDDTVFEDPWNFDITRRPNEHLGFGGGGPHFCMGAGIARTQLRALFGQLAQRVERFETGRPDYLTSNFVNAVKRLPCRFVTA